MSNEDPNESRTIYKITYSYLDRKGGSKRVEAAVDSYGKFESPNLFSASPREFLRYEVVQSGDPSLILKDGDKLRAFLGGDPRFPTAQSLGLLDNHEAFYRDKRKNNTVYDTDPFLSFPFIDSWSGSSD